MSKGARERRTDLLEHGLDALGRLCAHLGEHEALVVGKLLGLVGRDLSLTGLGEVELVAGEADDDGRVGLALQLGDPRAGLDERGLRGDGRQDLPRL